ncbi:MAG: DUF2892 domain-containing protein [Archangium sp.]
MTRNVGVLDRVMRAVVAVGSFGGALFAPWPLPIRIGVFGATGAYLLFSSVAGTCLGYRLMGRSTCPR